MLCRAVGLRDFTVEGIAFARQIVDAEMPFEECGHGIYGTFPPSGLEVERSVVSSPYFETVLSGPGCRTSYDDVTAAGLAFSCNLKTRSCGTLRKVLQQGGSPLGNAVAGGIDNARHGLAVLNKYRLGGEGERQNRK